MPRFLLDANISPKVGRYLQNSLELDVISVLKLGLGQASDQEVLHIASRAGRVLITLDKDFSLMDQSFGQPPRGVIYLDLQRDQRYTPEIQQVLGRFFRDQANEIDLENSFVTIRGEEISVQNQ